VALGITAGIHKGEQDQHCVWPCVLRSFPLEPALVARGPLALLRSQASRGCPRAAHRSAGGGCSQVNQPPPRLSKANPADTQASGSY
jgi:hypothetical protein